MRCVLCNKLDRVKEFGRFCSQECQDVFRDNMQKREQYKLRPTKLVRMFIDKKKKSAERRLYFDLDFLLFKKLTFSNCFYCGEAPSNYTKFYGFKYSGIDRVDNNYGYIETNCVPCCKHCNWMKSSMSGYDFINRVRKIYKNTRKQKFTK